MSIFDIILLVILLAAAVMGCIKGFCAQIGSIAGVVIGIIMCRIFGDNVKVLLFGPQSGMGYTIAAYAILFVVVYLLCFIVARLFSSTLSALHLGIINRVAGGVFSVLVWAIILSIVINIYLVIEPGDKGFFLNKNKPWRPTVTMLAPNLLGYLTN
ncbi:MAG: CvpA family protein [Bacteroidales bacterium]|nr:CvpA family protein [Bacteroidales bacterium]